MVSNTSDFARRIKLFMRPLFLIQLIPCSQTIQWCRRPSKSRPQPVLTVPMQMIRSNGDRIEVELQVDRGADVDTKIEAFASSWELGNLQLAELRRAVHAELIRTRTLVTHVISIVILPSCAGQEDMRAAVERSSYTNQILVFVLSDQKCEPAAASVTCDTCDLHRALAVGTSSLARATLNDIILDALLLVSPLEHTVVAVSTGISMSNVTIGDALFEHHRLKYGYGMLGEDRIGQGYSETGHFVLAVPSHVSPHADEMLLFDASAFRSWWPPQGSCTHHQCIPEWALRNESKADMLFSFDAIVFTECARLHQSFYRAWWLVADAITDSDQSGFDSTIDGANEAHTIEPDDEIRSVDCRSISNASVDVCPPFFVLTVEQGESDTSTAGSFADISASIASGLRSLGLTVREARCRMLGYPCATLTDQNEQLIVLGAHNLQVYLDTASGQPLFLTPRAQDMLDKRAVLYNYEYVPEDLNVVKALRENVHHFNHTASSPENPTLTNHAGTFISPVTLQILKQASVVWDYSEANLAPLKSLGVEAIHVPLGYAPPWRVGASLASAIKTTAFAPLIQVLFYGTLTPHRVETLRMLRSTPAPVQIYHANAASDGVFGNPLDALLLDAEIVLNLRAFGGKSEWKMPRLARLLSNEKFVISEGKCETDQCSSFRNGVVFVERDNLKAAIIHYLSRPDERREIARRGRLHFESQTQARALQTPIHQLLRSHFAPHQGR